MLRCRTYRCATHGHEHGISEERFGQELEGLKAMPFHTNNIPVPIFRLQGQWYVGSALARVIRDVVEGVSFADSAANASTDLAWGLTLPPGLGEATRRAQTFDLLSRSWTLPDPLNLPPFRTGGAVPSVDEMRKKAACQLSLDWTYGLCNRVIIDADTHINCNCGTAMSTQDPHFCLSAVMCPTGEGSASIRALLNSLPSWCSKKVRAIFVDHLKKMESAVAQCGRNLWACSAAVFQDIFHVWHRLFANVPRQHPDKKKLGARLSAITAEIYTGKILNPDQLALAIKAVLDEFDKTSSSPKKSTKKVTVADLASDNTLENAGPLIAPRGKAHGYWEKLLQNSRLLQAMVAAGGQTAGTTPNESFHHHMKQFFRNFSSFPAHRAQTMIDIAKHRWNARLLGWPSYSALIGAKWTEACSDPTQYWTLRRNLWSFDKKQVKGWSRNDLALKLGMEFTISNRRALGTEAEEQIRKRVAHHVESFKSDGSADLSEAQLVQDVLASCPLAQGRSKSTIRNFLRKLRGVAVGSGTAPAAAAASAAPAADEGTDADDSDSDEAEDDNDEFFSLAPATPGTVVSKGGVQRTLFLNPVVANPISGDDDDDDEPLLQGTPHDEVIIPQQAQERTRKRPRKIIFADEELPEVVLTPPEFRTLLSDEAPLSSLVELTQAQIAETLRTAYVGDYCFCTFADSANYANGDHFFGSVEGGGRYVKVRWTRSRAGGKWEDFEEGWHSTLPNDAIHIFFLRFVRSDMQNRLSQTPRLSQRQSPACSPAAAHAQSQAPALPAAESQAAAEKRQKDDLVARFVSAATSLSASSSPSSSWAPWSSSHSLTEMSVSPLGSPETMDNVYLGAD
jgi:hypothetical protein